MNEHCRCPNRPYHSLGSWGSGSESERFAVARWEEQHGAHAYAKARDELAKALQVAETSVQREEQEKAGEAILDMACDVMGSPRYSAIPKKTLTVATDGGIGELARRHGITLKVVPLPEEEA